MPVQFDPNVLNVPSPWDHAPPAAMTKEVMAPGVTHVDLVSPPWVQRPEVYDTLEYQLRPYPPTMEPQIAGLGAEAGSLDLIGMMRDMHEGYLDVAPAIDFFGNHPITTLMLVMGAIIAGGAAGGYIGAGLRSTAKKRR